jgi:hypothetical protein
MQRAPFLCLVPLLFALSGAEVHAQDQSDSLKLALDLPIAARDLRRAGVAEPDVRVILQSSRDKGLSANEGSALVRAVEEDVKARGPINNLGAFVHQKLGEGMRGAALAASIHAEHEANGQGRTLGQGEEVEEPEGEEEAETPRATKPKEAPKGGSPPPIGGPRPSQDDAKAERGGSRR